MKRLNLLIISLLLTDFITRSQETVAQENTVQTVSSDSTAVIASVKNAPVFDPNPHAFRYFFTPSAYNLKQGESFYQNTYLFFNSYNYGITNNFSVGATAFVTELETPIIAFTPKVGFQLFKNINVAGGLVLMTPDFSMFIPGAFGLVTVGNRRNNVTVGYYPFFSDEFYGFKPITVSAMFRLRRNLSLVTDNWILNDEYSILTGGIRIFGKKAAVDLGLVVTKDIFTEDMWSALPYVDFVLLF
jgi:hypothetical protein